MGVRVGLVVVVLALKAVKVSSKIAEENASLLAAAAAVLVAVELAVEEAALLKCLPHCASAFQTLACSA